MVPSSNLRTNLRPELTPAGRIRDAPAAVDEPKGAPTKRPPPISFPKCVLHYGNYVTVTTSTDLGSGLTRLLDGVAFSLGLILVVMAPNAIKAPASIASAAGLVRDWFALAAPIVSARAAISAGRSGPRLRG